MSEQRLFDLLPALYRLRDRAQGDPLRALLAVIEREVQRVEDDIAGLYDNWFIETCDEWVVPYIGDLLGVRRLAPVEEAGFSRRGYVANTLGYRRRKGTAAVLEQLARDVTGWPARAVELFAHLATTQHVNHVRLGAPATADVRDATALQYVSTPFESLTRTADVRHIDNGRGRHNVPNVGLFLWRLLSYPLVDVVARPVDAVRFTVDPLGLHRQLYAVPSEEGDIVELASPRNVPMPLTRHGLNRDLAEQYGDASHPRSVRVTVGGTVQPLAAVEVCDLSDHGAGWAHAAPAGTVAIDPILGRLAFADAPAGAVLVSYAYGLAGDLGGGPYDRRPALAPFLGRGVTWQMGVSATPPADEPRIVTTVADAVAAWNAQPPGTRGVIVVMDNRTFAEDLDAPATRIRVPQGSHLLIVAGQWPAEETGDPLEPRARRTGRVVPRGVRPHLHGTLEVAGTAPDGSATPGELVLSGLLLSGRLRVVAGNLGTLHVSHSTIAPGAGTFVCEANPQLSVKVTRSILGDTTPGSAAPSVSLVDTIVDGDCAARALVVDSSTVLGTTRAETLHASDAIFVGEVAVDRRQVGCVRFSYLPPASPTPRRYRCQPVAGASVRPTFVSITFGDAGYAVLAPSCPPEIAAGAEDDQEMGAWHFLQTPQRLRNLRLALDEYLRFGLEAGVFFAPQ